MGDGPGDAPAAVARRLFESLRGAPVEADAYGEGGVVEELEDRMATFFGKPAALVMPTGTLGNLLAVRSLVGDRSRVLVQKDAHLMRDSGDAAARLLGLTLLPDLDAALERGPGAIEDALERAADGKVTTGLGAISIESPMRRGRGATVDLAALGETLDRARSAGIGTHLDGARVLVACAWDGRSPAEAAAPFDTVMTSLWKLFGVPYGALLLGDVDRIARLRDERRRFGGALRGFWPAARLVLDRLDGCLERLRAARTRSEEVLDALSSEPGIHVHRVPMGTNVFGLRFERADPGMSRERVREMGVWLPSEAAADGTLWCSVNETWNHRPAAAIVEALVRGARS